MHPRRAHRLVIGVLAAALVLAGCGGSDSATSATQAAPGEPQVAPNVDTGAQPAAAAAADAPAADPAAEAPAAGVAPDAAAPAVGGGGKSKPAPAAARVAGGKKKAGSGTTKVPGSIDPPIDLKGPRTASDVGVTPDSIKVGHIGIYSGPVHGVGEDIGWAGQAVLRWYNDNGGINGRKLDVLVRDDAWDATKGMAAARDLVEREKIFGFCCIQTIPTNDALGPYVDEKKVPNVGGDGWGEAQYNHPWAWPTGGSATADGLVQAKYAYEQAGAKTMSIFYYDSPAGRDFRDQVTKLFESLGGKVKFAQPGTFDDPSTSTYVARSRAENVDMSLFWGEPGLWVKMIREAAIQAYKPPKGFWSCACTYFDEIPGLAGPWAEGSFSTVAWVPNDIVAANPAKAPGYAEYEKILTRYYPKINHSNWTRAGYVGGRLFGDTLKKLGLNVTRQGLKDALDGISTLDLGLGPKLQFWKDHRAVHSTYILRLEKDAKNPTSGGMRWKYFAGPFTDPVRKAN